LNKSINTQLKARSITRDSKPGVVATRVFLLRFVKALELAEAIWLDVSSGLQSGRKGYAEKAVGF
jgi:hypothetical protein